MKKNITIIVIFIIIIALFFVWYYVYSKIKDNHDSILESRKQIQIIDRNFANRKSTADLIETVKNDKDKIDAVFLSSENIIEFIKQMEVLSNSSEVTLNLTSATIPEFNFVVEGEFPNVFRFISLLENMLYKINFKSANIRKEGLKQVGEDEEIDLWRASINILLYSYEEI